MTERWLATAIALLPMLLPTPLAGDASAGFVVSRDGNLRLEATPRMDPLEINRLHAWDLRLARADGTPLQGAAIEVKGGMPAHDHGLPTRPRVRETGEPGLYMLEGMRFHMHGEWRLVLRVEAGGTRDELEWTLQL